MARDYSRHRRAECNGIGRGYRGWAELRPGTRPCGLARVGSAAGDHWGRPRLVGITKRGSKYLRKLLIHGARSGLPRLANSGTALGEWLKALIGRRHKNTAVVALANKLARIAWAVLRRGKDFKTAAAEATV